LETLWNSERTLPSQKLALDGLGVEERAEAQFVEFLLADGTSHGLNVRHFQLGGDRLVGQILIVELGHLAHRLDEVASRLPGIAAGFQERADRLVEGVEEPLLILRQELVHLGGRREEAEQL
jgi:hypothetical protein